MSHATFKALVVERVENRDQTTLQDLPLGALPEGDVRIAVAYSSLNYKDGLAVTGTGRIVRKHPMIPGIDLAGTVEESRSPDFKPGDKVVVTGWGMGETQWGGYAQQAQLKSEFLLPLPAGIDLKQAMAIGTAGLTAMLSVLELEDHDVPRGGEVVVTGACGGVGSVAVALLARLGYKVVASTGRAEQHGYLLSLGAQEIIDRSVLSAPSERPESARWSGAVDSVGGETLAGILRTMAPHGTVAVCGLAGGAGLNTTVMPFILRGVHMIGIDSNYCPQERRRQAWERLAHDLPAETLAGMTQVVPLAEVLTLSREILKGCVRGRIVVDVNA